MGVTNGDRAFTFRLSSWPVWPPYVLFFLMLFVPLAYQPVKAALLAATLGLIVLKSLSSHSVAIHRWVLAWALFMATSGLFFMLIGAGKAAPGAFKVGTVYVLWPLVYSAMVAGMSTQGVIDRVLKVLVFGTMAVALYSLSYALSVAGFLPEVLYVELNQGQGIGFHAGYVDVNLHSTTSLLFLIPFVVSALLIWPRQTTMPVSRFWLWATFAVSLVFAIISGRRALWMVMGIAPVLALGLRTFVIRADHALPTKEMMRVVLLAALAILLVVVTLSANLDLNIPGLVSQFAAAFNFSGNVGAFLRQEQFFALLRSWAEQPVFGAGLGATAAGSLRSVDFPWSYELFYVALLFQTGIVGVCIYVAAVGWIIWMGIRLIRCGHRLGLYMAPVLVGMSCFLLANATNPIIGKFDHIWVIFLPIAVINSWLLAGGRGRAVDARSGH